MGISLETLIARTRNRVAGSVDDAKLTDALLTDDVNDGLSALSEERDWPWLLTTTTVAVDTDDTEYALPDDLTKIDSVAIDNTPLTEVLYEEFLTYATRSASKPSVYTVRNGTLLVAPNPTSASTIDLVYYQLEPELEIDADETLVPVRFKRVVIAYAAAYTAARLRDPVLINNTAQRAQSELDRTVRTLRNSTLGARIATRTDNRL